MSMLCRLRKVLLSIGVSMLDGWGMGSHIRTAQVSGGSLKPHRPLLYILSCPVQCSTCRGQQRGDVTVETTDLGVCGLIKSSTCVEPTTTNRML